MGRRQQLKLLTAQLHISHNQIATYLACSLKYRYRYVERRPSERQGIALPFGIAIHNAAEHYYRTVKDTGSPAPLAYLTELCSDTLAQHVGTAGVPVVFNKTLPDIDQAHERGCGMLEAFVAGQKEPKDQYAGQPAPGCLLIIAGRQPIYLAGDLEALAERTC